MTSSSVGIGWVGVTRCIGKIPRSHRHVSVGSCAAAVCTSVCSAGVPKGFPGAHNIMLVINYNGIPMKNAWKCFLLKDIVFANGTATRALCEF